MKQIRPRKSEKSDSGLKDAAGPTNVSAREMDGASAVQMFPILQPKFSRGESQTVDD
jgi:hypothetical protein